MVHFPVSDYSRDLHITEAEYFWDSEPATPLIAFDGDFNSAIEDAMSEAVLPPSGPHVLSIRVKDIDGSWSPAFRRVVVVEDQAITRGFDITSAEYSWDSGTAIPLIAFDGDLNSAIEDIVSESSMTFPSGGAHVFSIRVQDEDGTWSPNFRRVVHFPVSDYSRDLHITEAEYFWDADPGQGNGFPLLAFDGAFDEAFENLHLPEAVLSNGVSVFNVRVKDINGLWSSPFRRVVSLEAAYGCTDTTAFNYNPLAFYDNGTCIEFAFGCMDSSMFNYDPQANTDDGSCVPFVYGCLDDSQFNYDPQANTDDGTCIPFMYGCTDDAQFNYDPQANTDDGTCIPFVYGCMDETQFNYNPLVNTDDGTCIDFAFGCTIETAFNYDPEANTDDGTCITDCVGSECCISETAWDLNTLSCTYENLCPADIVKDGFVAVDDLLELLSAFGYACEGDVELGEGGEFCFGSACCGENTIWCDTLELCIPFVSCPADITLDQAVGVNDLLTFLIYFGADCDESENFIECGESFVPWSCGEPWEYQGYDYETVQIGEQCWFAENLRAENYRNGDMIPLALVDEEWIDALEGMIAIYGGVNEVDSFEAFGYLYNRLATQDERLLCPSGWKLPTLNEWNDLAIEVGGLNIAGAELKSINGWSNEGNGYDSFGFGAGPGGTKYPDTAQSEGGGEDGYWWTTTPHLDGEFYWFAHFSSESDALISNYAAEKAGLSVRCIKD